MQPSHHIGGHPLALPQCVALSPPESSRLSPALTGCCVLPPPLCQRLAGIYELPPPAEGALPPPATGAPFPPPPPSKAGIALVEAGGAAATTAAGAAATVKAAYSRATARVPRYDDRALSDEQAVQETAAA
eukprot:3038979-Prymnesium_polylepis.1